MKFLVPAAAATERLNLRQFRDDDWRDLHDYYSDSEAVQYTVGKVFSEGETWRKMCGLIGHWHLRGYGPYAVEEKSSGKVLGQIGFWYPNDWPSPEISWSIARAHWGKGYASEAVRTCQAIGKEYLKDIKLISVIHRDNWRSRQLAEAVGAVLEDEQLMSFGRAVLYRHP